MKEQELQDLLDAEASYRERRKVCLKSYDVEEKDPPQPCAGGRLDWASDGVRVGRVAMFIITDGKNVLAAEEPSVALRMYGEMKRAPDPGQEVHLFHGNQSR